MHHQYLVNKLLALVLTTALLAQSTGPVLAASASTEQRQPETTGRNLSVFAPNARAAAGSSANLTDDSCALYPIAFSAQSLLDGSVGDTLTDIFNGEQPGNFGWLTWTGSPSVPTLVTSLTPPGDSQTYVNPEDPSDSVISVGDWIQGSPGVSNSKNVRDALDALKTMDIAVPVWDAVRGQGDNADYRVTAFARIHILDYQLPGQNRISARFLGYTCEGAVISLGKSVDATVLTPTLDLAFNVDQHDAIPGDDLAYTAIATNVGATLTLSGAFTVENLSDVVATVAYYDDLIDYQPMTGDEWMPLAGAAVALSGYSPVSPAPLTSGLTLNATGQPAPGVVYPTSGDGIVGTQLDPGGVAVWEYQATLSLSPEQVSLLLDPASVRDVRNAIHFEVTPRLAERGQPFMERMSFVDLLRPQSGNLTNVVLTMTLPDGERILFDATTTPALAILSPGASASVEATYQVPALASKGADETDEAYLARLTAADGANLIAVAEATATSSSGSVSALPRTAVTTQHVPVVTLLKAGPETVDPGETVIYELTLRNIGSAAAREVALEDLLPNNDLGLIDDAPMSLDPGASALAHASHTVPNAQPPGDLTDIASALWEDANDNVYGPVTDTFTTEVLSLVPEGVLTLAPAFAGPNVTGTQQTLVATLKDTDNMPLPGVTVYFAVNGPNTTTGEGVTGADGTVAFTYTGANNGFDSVQATAVIDGTVFESNIATIHWVTPTQTVTTSTIWARFFTADNSGIFKTPPTQAPVFGQAFPSINFNPPAGTVPGNTSGVGVNTRPFTNVTMDLNGNYAGTIVAQGNGFQAGVGSLHNFSAVFTGEFTIAEAGNATYDFFSDDGFIFGIGNGAQRVSGANTNPPASGLTPFEDYPVMGAYNRPTSPVRNSITVYFPEPGTYPFEIDYTECCGGQLALTLAVRETGFGVTPVGSLVISPNSTQTHLTGQEQTFTVTAQDASGLPLSDMLVMLRVSGANTQELTATTDATGVAAFSYTGNNVGADTVQAVAWAQGDISAYSAEVRVNWQRGAPPPTDPRTPLAVPGWIGSPINQSTLTGQVPIRLGSGINLQTGTIDYWPVDDPSALAVLATNVSGSGGSTLATFDTSLLANGSYIIRLQGTNTSGTQVSSGIMVTVQGEYKPGRVRFTIGDLTVPVTGLPITIGRTYDSLERQRVGDFGYGWSLAIGNPRVKVNPAHDVTITMPDGQRSTFYFTPYAPSPIFGFLLVPKYTAEPGMFGSLTSNGCGLLTVSGGKHFCFPGGLYEATSFTYTDPYGREFVMSVDGTLKSIRDLNDNILTFTPAGISSSAGLSVSFERDAEGRITRIVDPAGNVYQYSYDLAGDLVELRLPDITTPVTYSYDDDHLFLEGNDPRGNTMLGNTYYTDGRLRTETDAVGHTFEYLYDLNTRTTTVVHPDGSRLVSTYDSYGGLLEQTDPLGRTTSYTYDNNHKRLTETDGLGHVTSYTYDSNGNTTSIGDPLGHMTTVTYHQFGGPTRSTDPLGNVQTINYDDRFMPTGLSDGIGSMAGFTHDSHGSALTFTDAGGNTTTYTYDAFGNILSETNALGGTTTYTYDLFGRKLSKADPLGRITHYTYEALGRLLTETDPQGGVTRYTYDANGNLILQQDPAGRETEYVYDAANRLVQITYPDGTHQTFTYDWRDNVVTETDPSGIVTRYAYDLAGQLITITLAEATSDTATISYAYDSAGRLIQQTDPLGHATTYEYDAAGHLLKVVDPRGGITSHVYDAAGRRISTTDSNGHQILYAYDVRSRVTRTTYPDGTTVEQQYDGMGRVVSSADQAGVTTFYTYDTLGRLSTVRDALGGITEYQYDAVGNKIGIADANGHETSLEYDSLNRLIRRVLPLSQSEHYTYDAVGNVVSRTDANGKTTTYVHDAMNRLIEKIPDASLAEPTVRYSYTLNSQRATMEDATGLTTYTYDALGHLVNKATPFGALTYTYDLAGNLLSLRSSNSNGAWVEYTYDEMDRLTTVQDRRLTDGTTTYSYDTVGNLLEYIYPNGLRTTQSFDALNRLVGIETERSGTDLASYNYSLEPAGHRISVTELDGRTMTYAYDALYRLTSENVTGDPISVGNGTIAYTYDAMGNRLSRNSTIAAVPSETYSYDANDRLISDTYDANGNTIGSDVNNYSYNFENRLVQFNSGDVRLLYDGDGNLVSLTAGGITTSYLVDDRNPTGLSQVIEEIRDDNVQRTYSYGRNLISQNQLLSGSWAVSFYGYDGQGSVRYLTDASGTTVNTYTYDAFGNIVHSSSAVPNVHLYTGERFLSDLDLVSLRARYLNPAAGRFWTADPFAGCSYEPLSLNKYLYAHADPVNRSDPNGLFVCVHSNFNAGRIVHNVIGADFLAHGGTYYDTSINVILGMVVPGGRKRPDLVGPVGPTTQYPQVYEIKSVWSAGAGVVQLAGYLTILNTFDPLGPLGTRARTWIPGFTYVPPPVVPVPPAGFALVFPPGGGLILYCLMDPVLAAAVASLIAAWELSTMYKQAQFAFAG